MTLIGEGMETTRIVCDGEECVVKFSGDGLFSARDIAFVHEGNRWANVVTADRGEVSFIRCLFTGGVWDEAIKRGGDGLWLFGMVGGRIEACQAIGNDLNGIEVSGQAQPTLEGNTCRENKSCGIAYFENSAGVARQNICIGNEFHGIYVGGQAQPTLEGNTCRENKECGIEVSGQARPTLEGNTCRENKEYGIAYFENSAGVARQNICADNAIDDIYVAPTAQPILKDNRWW
jgi:parallel beta-helix repeat protein